MEDKKDKYSGKVSIDPGIIEDYLISGLSVIPVKQDKQPLVSWKQYQIEPIDIVKASELFINAYGVGIICGKVSGGLECIDFDAHDKDIESIYQEFINDSGTRSILSRGYIQRTPAGGLHMVYRFESEKYESSLKLANWPDGQTMIETRGEGGYFLASPTPNYITIQGSLTNLPLLSLEERDYIIYQAKKLNQLSTQNDPEKTQGARGFEHTDPVSYFNWNCADTAKSLLKQAGWKTIAPVNEIEYWTRPGKDHGTSASWGKKYNAFYVFSSSDKYFKNDCYYTPFQILIKLKFKGLYQPALTWINETCLNKKSPYIRVGPDYFKRIVKVDRFGIERVELKGWKKEEIRQDHSKEYLETIPKYDDFTIHPDNFEYSPVINNCYNLYNQFAHKPVQGQWMWTKILLDHIFGCQYYLGLRYLQVLYLHPERLMPILVLVSKIRQTRKTTFVNWLNMIFGNNVANISPEDLVNGFNFSYACSNIIVVEETLIEKSLTIEKVKALATAKNLTVNQKFVSQYNVHFFGKIILTSNNEEKFARIDEEEIRFFIRKVGLPKETNHNIEKNLREEIPAFLYYLTTLDPVDWTQDRTGFRPDELENDSLKVVKEESKTGLYKDLKIRIEERFLNDNKNDNLFYADPISIKETFYPRDNQMSLHYIRMVLKEDMHLKPMSIPEYHSPFGMGEKKMARFYEFRREQFTEQLLTDETDPNQPDTSFTELPF